MEMSGRYEWTRPKAWKMDWELRRESETVATLSSPAFFGTSMRGSFGGTDYVLRKGGLRVPGAAMNIVGEKEDLAVLSIDSLGKGTISYKGTPDLSWERTGQGEDWIVMEEGKGTLFTVHRDVKSRRPRGVVTIEQGHPALGPIILLSWFMISATDP
ncbi:MAG: hypothetical protein GXX95_07765 [Methanomassiliicoccus sp.]|nr:hypothetical protein [Methanomassiliicoccus sp.]